MLYLINVTYRFLREAPDEDRYWLARKAVGVISYLGKIKCSDCRNIDQEDVKFTKQGIKIKFQPDGEKESKVIYISNEKSEDGIHFTSIIQTYHEALKRDDIPVFPNSPFLFTGRRKANELESKFVNSALGKHI